MLITRSNYDRIYQVINSILRNEGANPAVACVFFAGFGAYILERHFGIDAQPRGGLAAYRFSGNDLVVFGERIEGGFTGDESSFHCWVEAEGWAIDFMAPAFAALNPELDIPAKMFQRPLKLMAPTLNDLARPGIFSCGPVINRRASICQCSERGGPTRTWQRSLCSGSRRTRRRCRRRSVLAIKTATLDR